MGCRIPVDRRMHSRKDEKHLCRPFNTDSHDREYQDTQFTYCQSRDLTPGERLARGFLEAEMPQPSGRLETSGNVVRIYGLCLCDSAQCLFDAAIYWEGERRRRPQKQTFNRTFLSLSLPLSDSTLIRSSSREVRVRVPTFFCSLF